MTTFAIDAPFTNPLNPGAVVCRNGLVAGLGLGNIADDTQPGSVVFYSIDATAHTITTTTTLYSTTGAAYGFFGSALTFSDDGLWAAAVNTSVSGVSGWAADSIAIFHWNGMAWVLSTTLTHPSGYWDLAGSLLLNSDGTTLVTRDYWPDGSVAGALRIYTRSGITWAPEQTITESGTGNRFGTSFALSPSANVLAALQGNSTADYATFDLFVYTRSAGVWTLDGSHNIAYPTGYAADMYDLNHSPCFVRDDKTVHVMWFGWDEPTWTTEHDGIITVSPSGTPTITTPAGFSATNLGFSNVCLGADGVLRVGVCESTVDTGTSAVTAAAIKVLKYAAGTWAVDTSYNTLTFSVYVDGATPLPTVSVLSSASAPRWLGDKSAYIEGAGAGLALWHAVFLPQPPFWTGLHNAYEIPE